MNRRVVVVGGGVGGTAAAYAASRLGAYVTLIVGGPGATSLASGALDGEVGAAADQVRGFVDALGIWQLGACRLATAAGLLRPAKGRCSSVLDLEKTEPGVVGVVDVLRRGWDARGQAEAWTSEPFAIEHRLRFEPVAVETLRRADEDVIPLVDLAARHDDPERVSWLRDRLRESSVLREMRAVVMGPWLGLRSGVASELSRALGKPVGEPLSAPGGATGLRFERARDALLAKIAIERVDDWATAVRADESDARVDLASGSRVAADAIVLALGGLAGGGIEWSPATAACGFTTSLDHPATLALRGRPLAQSGSLEGALFEKFSWHGESASTGIERVGVWTDGEGQARLADGTLVPWLYAAGDAVADAPRTVLEAIRSGLAAGARASRAPTSSA